MMDQYCIGSARVPGLSKVVEECGEVSQVAGKIIGLGSIGEHWDGTNLKDRLEAELGALLAAVDYLVEKNGLSLSSRSQANPQLLFISGACPICRQTVANRAR